MSALEDEERYHLVIAALIALFGACVLIGALNLALTVTSLRLNGYYVCHDREFLG